MSVAETIPPTTIMTPGMLKNIPAPPPERIETVIRPNPASIPITVARSTVSALLFRFADAFHLLAKVGNEFLIGDGGQEFGDGPFLHEM